MGTRILLADDHRIIREGLCALLEKEPGIKVVGQAENGRMALELAKEHSPDVIVMDVSMPDLNGMEATRQIVAACPKVRVIALSMHSDRGFVSEMLSAGASGYLLKDNAFRELVRAIKAVAAGETYLCPRIAKVVREDYVGRLAKVKAAAAPELSPREREVLQLIAEGLATKQIARRLSISSKTVEWHRTNIMKKLNIHSVAELTKYAVRAGITTLEA